MKIFGINVCDSMKFKGSAYPEIFCGGCFTMGVRKGGQEGALAPPWPVKIVCFLSFLKENSLFLGIF